MGRAEALKKFAKQRLAFGPLTRRLSRNHAYILLYHRILPDSECKSAGANHALHVSASQFDAHLSYLKAHTNIVALSALIRDLRSSSRPSSSRPRVAITFDDGWRDNYLHAFPLLKKHNAPATIFLVTDFIENGGTLWWESLHKDYQRNGGGEARNWLKRLLSICADQTFPDVQSSLANLEGKGEISADLIIEAFKPVRPERLEAFTALLSTGANETGQRQLITWNEAKEMQANGIEFGAHTARHELLEYLSADEIRNTVSKSVDAMKNNGVPPIEIFCYPNGSVNELVEAEISKLGFEYAVSTTPGVIRKWPVKNQMRIPRINIGGGLRADTGYLRERMGRAFWLRR